MDKGLSDREPIGKADRNGSSAVLSMPDIPKKDCADSHHNSCLQMLLSSS